MRFWWRVFAAIVAASAGLVLGLEQFGEWSLPDWLGVVLVTAAALVAFITAAEAAYAQHRHGRVEEIREQARAILSPLLIELEEETGVSLRQLGLAAYRLRPSVWPFRGVRLERLLRMQLVIRVSSGIAWRPGVGVIGQCVERGEDVVENLAKLDDELQDVDRTGWPRLTADQRYGFTYDEYQKVRGKYGVVLATPLIQETPLGSQVIGCLAVDAPVGAFQKLASEDTRGLVAAAAVTLAALLSGRR